MAEASQNPEWDESRMGTGTVAVPAPTAWPMVMALGVALLLAGLVINAALSVVGTALMIAGAVGWFGEVLPQERREEIPMEAPVAFAAAALRVPSPPVGEQGHRAILPLEIYPYSAGIKGGIAGGIVMAALAALQGIIIHGSPWYTINILAAAAMANLAHASTATLCAFHPDAFFVALLLHGVVSLLVGSLYGVMLPMLPSYPMFMGGVVAPALWTGLLWATLDVINPLLDARIEWRWFILCQVAFGVTAGLVVAHSERIRTFQHLPFALRSGLEASGLDPHQERE